LIDFIKGNDEEFFLFVYFFKEDFVDFIRRKACCWNVCAELFGELCDDPVFCVCDPLHFAVDVDELDGNAFFSCEFLKFIGDIGGDEGFSCACFSVDEDIGGLFYSDNWREDACEGVDLFFAMRNGIWGVIGLEDFLVGEKRLLSEVIFKEGFEISHFFYVPLTPALPMEPLF